MKRITSLFLILCLTSCVSKKHLVQTGQVDTETTLNSVVSNGSTTVTNLTDIRNDSTDLEWETITRRFDTSAAPDSLGKHPLKEEVITHAKKKMHSSGSMAQKVASISGSKSESNKNIKESRKNSSKIDKSVSVAGGNWIILLWILLALAAILFLYFFVIRKWLK